MILAGSGNALNSISISRARAPIPRH